MIFTPNQIDEILNIMRSNTLMFIAGNVGIDTLTDADKELLRKSGINLNRFKTQITPFEQSYYFGRLSQLIGNNNSQNLTYTDLLSYLRKGQFHPLTKYEQQSLKIAKQRTYGHIKGLGEKIVETQRGIILEEDQIARVKYEKVISEAVEEAVIKREGVKSIVSEIGKKTGDWKRDLGRIADTELQNVYQLGRANQILEEKGGDALVYKETFSGSCKHCIRLHLTKGIGSKPRIFKLSQLIANGSNIGRKVVKWKATVSPIHPFCFNNPMTKILTVGGWVWIKDIVEGDLVMTHKNRFRKVTSLIRSDVRDYVDLELFDIEYKFKNNNGSWSKRKVKRVTGGHAFFVNNGWVEAKDLSVGDKINVKTIKCEECDNNIVIDVNRDGLNLPKNCLSCITRRDSIIQWRNPDIRNKMSKAVSKGNYKRYEGSTIEERREITKEARRVFNEKYPDGRPWQEDVLIKVNSTNGKRKTFIERKLHYFLDSLGVDYNLNWYVKNDGSFINNVRGYFPDIYIPSINVVIEADGAKWHKDRYEYDKNRDIDIKRSIGADTFRFLEKDIRENGDVVFNKIKNITNNHSGNFGNRDVEIVSISKSKEYKNSSNTLYNFSVEDDESYVADGVVVHNCRCQLKLVPEGMEWSDEEKRFVVSKTKTKIERPKAKVTVGDKVMWV